MTKPLSVLLLVICAFYASAAPEPPRPKVIEVSTDNFPTEREEIDRYLWSLQEQNAKKWAEPFHEFGTRGWATRYKEYSHQLLSEIQKTGHATPGIESIFIKILADNPDGLALLPYLAYDVETSNGRIWIIQCAWERPVPETPDSLLKVDGIQDKQSRDHTLMHVRLWAFQEPDFEIVGFSTCL